MNKATKHLGTIAGLSALVLLSACGGGGDNDPVVDNTPRPPASEFAFDETPSDSALFLRVDRTGAPAVATALLSRNVPGPTIVNAAGAIVNPGQAANTFNDQRDQLNRGDPVNDGRDFAGTFVAGPQPNSLKNIHFKIGPELRSLGLTTCSTEPAGGAATFNDVNVDVCVAQAAPVIIPDVIVYNFDAPEGFPNGRTFDDPVADRLLTAALLRISPVGGAPAPHGLDALTGVIDPWNGPTGQPCAAPCRFTGDETSTFSPATFPYLRALYP
jgi:hypothetical protein